MFKVNNNIAATIIDDILTRSYHSYNFAQNLIMLFQLCINGQNSMQYYDTLIQNMIPDSIKDSENLDLFKGKVRKWNLIDCPLHATFAKKCKPNLVS